MTKRAKRRALLYGELMDQELEPKPDPEDEEELTMKVITACKVRASVCLARRALSLCLWNTSLLTQLALNHIKI